MVIIKVSDLLDPFINRPPRQLVGKTRRVFRRPDGSNTAISHPIGIIVHVGPFGRESLRLTEDPAGLPYKLSRRWVGY
jgi:hypothetical protein